MSLTFHDLSLSHEITRLSQEITSLKTRQAYSTAQIKSSNAYSIYVGAYDVTIPSIDGYPSYTIQEVAATFLFTGSLSTKVAVGTFNVQPTYTGSDVNQRPYANFMAWMPTTNQNELRLGIVWRFVNYTGLNVSINTNMPGTFALEKTYSVYLT